MGVKTISARSLAHLQFFGETAQLILSQGGVVLEPNKALHGSDGGTNVGGVGGGSGFTHCTGVGGRDESAHVRVQTVGVTIQDHIDTTTSSSRNAHILVTEVETDN